VIAALLMLLLAVAPALAADLAASLPVSELTVGQTVELEVQLTDGDPDGLPAVPHGPGLAVAFQGQGQSVVSVNFQTTRIVRYTYTVTALSEGIHQLGPITQRVRGDTLRVEPARVTVAPRSAAQKTAHDLRVSLTDDQPFVGEVISYNLRYRRTQEIHGRSFELPDFDGFLQDKSLEPQGREFRVEEDGQLATVEEFWVPLVATGLGDRTISPALLTLQIPEAQKRRDRRFDPFFDRTPVRTERLASDSLRPTVRPLPDDGRPDDFSGLVGTFGLKVVPSTRDVPLGGSVTVEVTLTGSGALAGFSLPPLPPDSGLRAYDDSPEVTVRLQDGRYIAHMTQKRAIVPEREGALTLPPVSLSVFDPDREAYVRLRSDPVEITVRPGDAGGEVASFGGDTPDQRQDVAALGDDILPAPGEARVRDRSLAAAWPLALGMGVLPLAAFAGLRLQGRVRARPRDPKATLRARLGSLPSNPTDRLAALELLFREAAGLRLGAAAPGIDKAQVATLGPDAARLYADLDAARYGGASVADLEPRVRAFVEETP
jgi:hypothetical protein